MNWFRFVRETYIPIISACVMSAALLTAVDGCTVLDPDPRASVTDTTTSTTPGITGKTLYEDYCIACHGPNGDPATAGIESIRGYDKPFVSFDSAMIGGPGIMPSYQGKLDEDARRMIYEYVLTFK